MTQEQKAKAYDRALKYAMIYYTNGNEDMKMMMKTCFPVLVEESEDDRIRKELITHCRNTRCVTEEGAEEIAKWIAWLEKQGEEKVSVVDFKAEDWYVSKVDGKIYNAKFMEQNSCKKTTRRGEIEKAAFSTSGIIEQTDWFIKGAEWADEHPCCNWLEKQSCQKSIDELTPQEAMDVAVAKCFKKSEQNLTNEMKSAEESLGISSEEYNKIVDDCIYGKHTDKIEPKFKIGDWIVNKFGDSWHINSFDKKNYQVSDGEGNYNYFSIVNQDEIRLWTIKDAKDGDVLASDKGGVFIYAKVLYNKPYAYCGIDKFGVFKDNCLNNNWANSVDNIHPATKEQRDTLMKAMTDAGWEFDFDKKKLKKISQRMISAEAKEAMYDKPTDLEVFINELSKQFPDVSFAKLSRIAVRVAKWAKPAWSEEDKSRIDNLCHFLEEYGNQYYGHLTLQGTISWLKSLKERI